MCGGQSGIGAGFFEYFGLSCQLSHRLVIIIIIIIKLPAPDDR
jgi:hypothetical protein